MGYTHTHNQNTSPKNYRILQEGGNLKNLELKQIL